MIPDFSEQGHLVYKVVKIKEKEMEIFCKIAEVSWGGCSGGMWETVPGEFSHVLRRMLREASTEKLVSGL